MIISNSMKFIFIHVSKTGGASIQNALVMYKSEKITNRYNGAAGHVRARNLKKRLSPDVFNSYFKFAFVRNPWDRLVSKYHAILKAKGCPYHSLICSMRDFDEYLQWCINVSKLLNFQKDFLCDCEGNLLVDFIGRFENLENDFRRACDLLGIRDVMLPHLHKTNHRHYRHYYTNETRELVYNTWRVDIEMFGYKF